MAMAGRCGRWSMSRAGKVAKLAGATREQVVFTGSATEAITQAIVGGAKALGVARDCGVGGVPHGGAQGGRGDRIAGNDGSGSTTNGVIRVDEIAAAVARGGPAKLLVAVHLVNNETGVIQPIDRSKRWSGRRRTSCLSMPFRHLARSSSTLPAAHPI